MDEHYKDTAKVARKIDAFSFVINRGSDHGMEVGINCLIFRLGDNINDPDTGEDLGKLELIRGRARIVHVQEKISTLKSTDKETTPGTIRKIRREGATGLWAFAGGPREEEIEEGKEIREKPIDVQIGDMVRPI